MSNKRKEIECLERLNNLTASSSEIITFLLSEKLTTSEVVEDLKKGLFHDKLHTLLKGLQAAETIQLLEYEWSILPVERIKITIVTSRNQKEFTFNF